MQDFEQYSAKDIIASLGSDASTGLSDREAASRLGRDGANKLAEPPKKTRLAMFFAQMNDTMIYILFAAAVLSVILKEYSDAIIILAVVLLNAIIGMVQEGKAQDALDALKKLSSPTATVIRGGKHIEIDASELVSGDIVVIEAGRIIPADIRIIESANLEIDESALTGESLPAKKNADFVAEGQLTLGDRVNMAYMSTQVTYGRGVGIVVKTGMRTEIGSIAAMISKYEDEQTPLQKRLGDLGKLLGIIAVAICVLLFVVALIQRRDFISVLMTAISLAVAAVPEGLPAIVTIVLALGVQRMVKVNTIVRRLPSVETLGAVSVVCSDKTGTLTQNRMTVMKYYFDGAVRDVSELPDIGSEDFIRGFVLCSDARADGEERYGDPTELALIDMGSANGIVYPGISSAFPRIGELPFDSVRKMMTTLHSSPDGNVSYTKGAADEILKRVSRIETSQGIRDIREEDFEAISAAMSGMADGALRVLALAKRNYDSEPTEEELTFVGLVGMLDPPRPEAKDAVESFKRAGIRTIMITGDHRDTAFAIARELGIASSQSECMSGSELDAVSDEELASRVGGLSVFARVSPEHKVKIVTALRSTGKTVSMTGDGVNDAPSLKAADIGVAMGITGTDVAKSASDMVLTDDNFATIEKAVAEGRSIYNNIKKSVVFLLSSNVGEIITMFISTLFGLALALKPIHILWINLLTDSLPALALGVDPGKRDVMTKPPRDPKEGLFAHGGIFLTVFYGCLIALVTLAAFITVPVMQLIESGQAITISNLALLLPASGEGGLIAHAQTYSFTVLALVQLFHAIGMRDVGRSVFRTNPFSNKLMIIAFAVGIVLQVLVCEVPFLVTMFGTVSLGITEWLYLAALSVIPLIAHEIIAPFMKRN